MHTTKYTPRLTFHTTNNQTCIYTIGNPVQETRVVYVCTVTASCHSWCTFHTAAWREMRPSPSVSNLGRRAGKWHKSLGNLANSYTMRHGYQWMKMIPYRRHLQNCLVGPLFGLQWAKWKLDGVGCVRMCDVCGLHVVRALDGAPSILLSTRDWLLGSSQLQRHLQLG